MWKWIGTTAVPRAGTRTSPVKVVTSTLRAGAAGTGVAHGGGRGLDDDRERLGVAAR